MLSLNLTSTQHAHHFAPVQPSTDESETEVVVAQYSPTWVSLILAGASVRAGNIVETATVNA